MVDELDDTDNQVDDQGWRLVLALMGGFRALVDDAHGLLAERGHPGARPAHGFALQAVGSGATAAEVAMRLGVSKQAAAKTVARLEREGYVRRSDDPADARRRVIVPTDRGVDLLRRSAEAFAEVTAGWRRTLGDRRVTELLGSLTTVGEGRPVRFDLAAWTG